METPVKYRSKKWKEKQRATGKKQVTKWLSERTKNVLDNEKRKTGKTLSKLIDGHLKEQLKIKDKRKIIRRV